MDLDALKVQIIEQEKRLSELSFSCICADIEKGKVIDFNVLKKTKTSYHSNMIDSYEWQNYLNLCEQYYYATRDLIFGMIVNATDEETLVIKNKEIEKLNDYKILFEVYMEYPTIPILNYLKSIPDYITISVKKALEFCTTTTSDKPIANTHDKQLDLIINNTIEKLEVVKHINDEDLINMKYIIGGISNQSLTELLLLINEEKGKIQAMQTNEYKKYKISLMQPDLLEQKNITERYSQQLNGARRLTK